MKQRIIALLLAIGLACSMGLACAESAPKYHMIEDFEAFDVDVAIPEDATYQQNPQEGWLCLEIWYENGSTLYFDLNVSPSEEVDGKSLQDFTQEEKEHMQSVISEDFLAPAHEYFVTPSGTTVLYSRETDQESGDFATMQTVYNGYFFYLYACHKDYSPLTEEDIQLMHWIVEGVDIIDTSK